MAFLVPAKSLPRDDKRQRSAIRRDGRITVVLRHRNRLPRSMATRMIRYGICKRGRGRGGVPEGRAI